MTRLLPLILIFCYALTGPARAWDAQGHRFICTVASYEMSAAARGAAKDLLGVGTREQFADLCVWADEIAGPRPETAGWHRMYVPHDAQTVDMGRDCADPDRCVIAAIARHLETLKSGAAAPVRAEALKFVMHLTGDLHQPLNIGFADDGGGAAIAATFHGRATTLRDIWETGLLAARPDSWREMADSYDKRFPYIERRLWPAGTLTDWANESLWIARTPATGYVGNPGGLEFGELYVRQNQLTALRRLSQAGVRLASLLNKAFGG